MMAVRKVRLLLTARGEAPALTTALKQAVADVTPPRGVKLAFGSRAPGDHIEGSGHGEAIGPAPGGFEAMVEAFGEDLSTEALVEALAPIVDAVSGQVDLARSAVLAGNQHLLAPTDNGPFMLVFALRRPQQMSREAFFDYWANRHGPMIAKGLGERGTYYQFRGDEDATRSAAQRLGAGIDDFDGHAGGWLRDPSVLGVSMKRPQAAIALDDERQFIDHPRSMLVVYDIRASA